LLVALSIRFSALVAAEFGARLCQDDQRDQSRADIAG